MRLDRPSRTACKVAMNIVTLGAKPGMGRVFPAGIVKATEQLLVASGAAGLRTVQWARSQRMISVHEAFDWMMPGQFEAFAHRKAFFERQVRTGIEDGATQILVLGAGYDTLGWRLAPEFPHVNFLEIDHPATARLKFKGISEMGQRDNLLLIAEDLSNHKLNHILSTSAPWKRNVPAVIVAEGLVMYLSPESVRDLFCQCAEIAGDGSRFVFSYIPNGADGRLDAGPWTGLMLWLQKVTGESWLWSIEPEAMNSFLEETGWKNNSDREWSKRKYGIELYAVAVKQA